LWEGKEAGDGLLGSEAVNSRWDISESWSDTADNVLGDVDSGTLRVDDQSRLESKESGRISVAAVCKLGVFIKRISGLEPYTPSRWAPIMSTQR
jgi:hypothetical protein